MLDPGGKWIKLYKSGSTFLEIEPLSEFLASQLAEVICRQAVLYDLDYYHGKLISKCPLFTSETVGLAKASAVFHGAEHTIPDLLRYFRGIGGEDAFRRMCVLDAIILNPDRHYGNFGVLFDTATMEVLRWLRYLTTTRACCLSWTTTSWQRPTGISPDAAHESAETSS